MIMNFRDFKNSFMSQNQQQYTHMPREQRQTWPHIQQKQPESNLNISIRDILLAIVLTTTIVSLSMLYKTNTNMNQIIETLESLNNSKPTDLSECQTMNNYLTTTINTLQETLQQNNKVTELLNESNNQLKILNENNYCHINNNEIITTLQNQIKSFQLNITSLNTKLQNISLKKGELQIILDNNNLLMRQLNNTMYVCLYIYKY